MTTSLPCDIPVDMTSPLIGTVKPFTRWFLVEEPPTAGEEWGSHEVDTRLERDALLRDLQAQVPGSQIVFIKQGNRAVDTRRFFVCDPHQETLYAADLDSWEVLAAIDARGDIPTLAGQPMQPVEEPLYVVCTNASRDCRCGELGTPVYDALREQLGGSAWESTHITGHKFAATLYIFPQAVAYGRLLPEHVPALVEAHASDQLLLEHYRGRSIYDNPTQIAQHYLLSHANRSGLHDFEVLRSQRDGNQTIIWARLAGEDITHRLTVDVRENGFSVVEHE